MQGIKCIGKRDLFVLQSREGIDLKTFNHYKGIPRGTEQVLWNVSGEVDLGSKISHYLITKIEEEHVTTTVEGFWACTNSFIGVMISERFYLLTTTEKQKTYCVSH